jgi:hypothetical protein
MLHNALAGRSPEPHKKTLPCIHRNVAKSHNALMHKDGKLTLSKIANSAAGAKIILQAEGACGAADVDACGSS